MIRIWRAVLDRLDDASLWRRVHGWCILGWAFVWGVAHSLGWINSVVFLSEVTMATALITSAAAWASARGEVKQDEANGASG